MVRRLTIPLRPYDALGRVGGEEFLLLVPLTTGEDARAILERVRQAVGATPVEYLGGKIEVTISLGGTTTLGDEAEDEILFRADEALYRAKELGRNRVEMTAE